MNFIEFIIKLRSQKETFLRNIGFSGAIVCSIWFELDLV